MAGLIGKRPLTFMKKGYGSESPQEVKRNHYNFNNITSQIINIALYKFFLNKTIGLEIYRVCFKHFIMFYNKSSMS